MGIRVSELLSGSTVYACSKCRTHLAVSVNIISKDYVGSSGKAFLMSDMVNLEIGKVVEKYMITGTYLIQYTFCHQCGSNIGWRYLKASDEDQSYKQGKFIMELKRVLIL